MGFKERILYLTIIILGGLYIYFMIFPEEEKYVVDYNTRIKNLEQKVDSLHYINDELVFKIDTLNTQITQLDQEIDLKDNKINTLKYEVNAKIDAVDSFNDDELERYFTERYKEYLNSVRKDSSSSGN